MAENDANETLTADDLLPKAYSLLVGEGVVIKGEAWSPTPWLFTALLKAMIFQCGI